MNQFNPLNDNDDFQFKPLTEGLGFHKKTETDAAEKKSTKSTTWNPQMSADLDLTTPLPRKGYSKDPLPSAPSPATQNTVDDILKTLSEKRNLDFSDKQKLRAKPVDAYRSTSVDFAASLLDSMLIVAATLFCLIVLLVVTNVDLFANLYHPDQEGLIYMSLAGLIFSVAWIYLVTNRVFLGCTPGEWVFDQRLGRPDEMGSVSYALKTIARTTVTLLTGFVVFPILSMLTNRDMLGRWMGLELVRKTST